jgi:hypothetical protein
MGNESKKFVVVVKFTVEHLLFLLDALLRRRSSNEKAPQLSNADARGFDHESLEYA